MHSKYEIAGSVGPGSATGSAVGKGAHFYMSRSTIIWSYWRIPHKETKHPCH